MTTDVYESTIEQILDTHLRELINTQVAQLNWDSTLQDIFLDEWYDTTFTDYTYSSITNCVEVNSPEDVASRELLFHEGAEHVLNNVVYRFVNQDLQERFNTYNTIGIYMLQILYPCIQQLLTTRVYETPTELRSQFNHWFVYERTNQNNPASTFDPIPTSEFTPAHITQQTLIPPSKLSTIRPLLWWLYSEHTDIYTNHTTSTPAEI